MPSLEEKVDKLINEVRELKAMLKGVPAGSKLLWVPASALRKFTIWNCNHYEDARDRGWIKLKIEKQSDKGQCKTTYLYNLNSVPPQFLLSSQNIIPLIYG